MVKNMSVQGGSALGRKICLINNLFKPYNRGGAERVVETLAIGLRQAGHEVFIITTKPYFEKYPIANNQYPIYYLNSLYYNLGKFPKLFRFFWHLWDMVDLINYFKIKRILREQKPDVVITNNLTGLGWLTIRATKRLKIKQLHLAHDIQLIHPSGLVYFGKENEINSYFARNYAGLMSWLVDSPEIVIFPSRWLLEAHLDKIFFIRSKRLVLPNPAEAKLTAGQAKANGQIKFLFIGQIEEHKGIFLLINAFKKLKNKFKKIDLIVAGDGRLAEQIKKLAEENNFIYLGKVDEDKIDELLADSTCLIYPSLVYENCPNAIERALACGLPVIASDLGGISELLSKNAGLLFKPADENDLVEKMAWLVNNQADVNNIIQLGREKAALFKVDNYLKELLKLIT